MAKRVRNTPARDDERWALLRYSAGLHFVLDTDCIAMEAMLELPQFAEIGIQRLRKWADEDQWLTRRQANLGRWRSLIEQKMGESLAEQRFKQYEQLMQVWDQGIGLASSCAVKPTSWDGVVGVLARLAPLLETMRDSIAKTALPDDGSHPEGAADVGGQGGLPAASMPQISDEEARAVAHMILRQRKIAALGPDSSDDENEDDLPTPGDKAPDAASGPADP